MTEGQRLFDVEVRVTPREGILDPEGETIARALGELGYEGVERVRAGRLVGLRIRGRAADAVRQRVEQMCEELIANPVIEDYAIRVTAGDESAGAGEVATASAADGEGGA